MRSLILHSSTMAQWQTLLSEAQQSASIYLEQDLEAYLVFLLMRYVEKPEIASSVLGLEFLNQAENLSDLHRKDLLRDIGDKCLLFAGLFPGRAIQRRVKISYYVKLGQIAYTTVSHCSFSEEKLFLQLGQEFPKLMDVLHATREQGTFENDLLQTLELWHETGSQLAWKRFQKTTKGLPVMLDQNRPQFKN